MNAEDLMLNPTTPRAGGVEPSATRPAPAARSIRVDVGSSAGESPQATSEMVAELDGVSCFYGSFRAIRDVSTSIQRNRITALIGPSGCGKSTLLRTMNRMNDLVPGFRVEGRVVFEGTDVFDRSVDAVALRRLVGMVFQKPNPFPKSIFDNVAFGPRINGYRGDVSELVEASLRRAALWDEVKDKLKHSALALSGGQQQRLCIARTIAVEPELILMDEPCSALDPRATLQILIVTHNMQQAARASDHTVFLTMGDDRAGYLVEEGPTNKIFTNPREQLTGEYVSGRFG
jgi:phosphate transport system ATP-binding protein